MAGENVWPDRSGTVVSELADFSGGISLQLFLPADTEGAHFSVALIASILSFPALPFIVLAVKLGSPGPALYRQQRVGRRGKVFFLQVPHYAARR